MSKKYPIIAHGELYAEPVAKPLGGGPKERPHEYAEAKRRILDNLDALAHAMTESAEVFMDEIVLCVRLEPKFEAKSYVPTAIISAMESDAAELIGGRRYTAINDEGIEMN